MEDSFNLKVETRLDTVEKQGVDLTHRLQNVEVTQRRHGEKMDGMSLKLDQIVQAVTKHEAAPKVDPKAILSTTKDIAILLGLVATLLGFVINSYGAGERAVNSWRLTQLERAVGTQTVQTQTKADRAN